MERVTETETDIKQQLIAAKRRVSYLEECLARETACNVLLLTKNTFFSVEARKDATLFHDVTSVEIVKNEGVVVRTAGLNIYVRRDYISFQSTIATSSAFFHASKNVATFMDLVWKMDGQPANVMYDLIEVNYRYDKFKACLCAFICYYVRNCGSACFGIIDEKEVREMFMYTK